MAIGKAQVEHQTFQFIRRVQFFVIRLELFGQAGRDARHPQVTIRLVIHRGLAHPRRPGGRCGRGIVRHQNHSRIELGQQPLHRRAVQILLAHIGQMGAEQAENFLEMRQIVGRRAQICLKRKQDY